MTCVGKTLVLMYIFETKTARSADPLHTSHRVVVRMRESYKWHRAGDVGVLVNVNEAEQWAPVQVHSIQIIYKILLRLELSVLWRPL